MRRSLVLAAVALVVAGCGGGGGADDAAPARPAVTPVPTVFGGIMRPGVAYTTTAFRPRLRITLPPADWKVLAHTLTSVELEPATEQPVSDAGINFFHRVKVFDAERGGRIPGDAIAPPKDFAAWLATHPHLRTSRPRPVKALGLDGVAIDARVTSSQPVGYKDCGKVAGDCVVMLLGGVEPLVYGSETRARWLVLDLGDEDQLLVEQWVQPAAAFARQIGLFDRALAGTRLVR